MSWTALAEGTPCRPPFRPQRGPKDPYLAAYSSQV